MVIKQDIIEILKNFQDPELGLDIYTLGLIYEIDFDEKKQELKLQMTFTSPMCPFGAQMVGQLKEKFKAIGIDKTEIEIVFNPPWAPSAEVREMLGV